MKIILAAIFLFFIYAGPVYSIRLQDTDVYEEKSKIIEKVTPIREAREKNLHPFVQDTVEVSGSPAIYPGIIGPAVKYDTLDSGRPPVRGVNFIFVSIILAAFFLSYFFIRPKSK